MNIFITDHSPRKCANDLDDKRLVKMVLETTQMLNTVLITQYDEKLGMGYKPTHANHPCTLWVGSNQVRYVWTLSLLMELCREYTRRYHRHHKCEQYIKHFRDCLEVFDNQVCSVYGIVKHQVSFYKNGEKIESLIPFCNCATDFKDEEDVIFAYRQQLVKKWNEDQRHPTWDGKVTPPGWCVRYGQGLFKLHGGHNAPEWRG